MKEFEFTLKFSLPDTNTAEDVLIKRLEEEGCDDALIGLGTSGRLALLFNRKGKTGLATVVSAIKNVEAAIPGIQLVEATPDLVGVSDIAGVLKISRQYVRKLILQNKNSFPLPVHEGKVVLWHLSNVLQWLAQKKQYSFDASLTDIAQANIQINLIREASCVAPAIHSKVFFGSWLSNSNNSKWDALVRLTR